MAEGGLATKSRDCATICRANLKYYLVPGHGDVRFVHRQMPLRIERPFEFGYQPNIVAGGVAPAKPDTPSFAMNG